MKKIGGWSWGRTLTSVFCVLLLESLGIAVLVDLHDPDPVTEEPSLHGGSPADLFGTGRHLSAEESRRYDGWLQHDPERLRPFEHRITTFGKTSGSEFEDPARENGDRPPLFTRPRVAGE